jgi:hypothetical protein
MINLVKTEYHDFAVTFTDDAWFNATTVAERFGKNPHEWLRLPVTQNYLSALERKYGNIPYLKTRRGQNGGTWLHPKLGVTFARWLDIDFSIWCDEQIDGLLKGNHPHYDWKRLRHEATASYKVMGQILQMTLQREGKESYPYHFSNEARLINHTLTGVFGKVDRDGLQAGDLDLLAKLENLNAVLIGCGANYEDRKKELGRFVIEQRSVHTPLLEVAG